MRVKKHYLVSAYSLHRSLRVFNRRGRGIKSMVEAHPRKFAFFLLIVAPYLILFAVWNPARSFFDVPKLVLDYGGDGRTTAKANLSEDIPLIVAWNRFHTLKWIPYLNRTFSSSCPKHCRFVERDGFEEMRNVTPSAYIFHMRSEIDVTDLPKREPHQLFVTFMHESPQHDHNDFKELPPNFFNATMNYRRTSDYFAPYGQWVARRSSDPAAWYPTDEQLNDIIKKKSKSILFLSSNCRTPSQRLEFLSNLTTRTNAQVSMNEKCISGVPGAEVLPSNCVFDPNANIPMSIADDSEINDCEKLAAEQHYFYFAFENGICDDYVTEKTFRRQAQFLVPIVQSRSIYEMPIIPKDSFIAVDDFDSYEALALHLTKLMQNIEEYKKYLDFHKSYRLAAGEGLCDLCLDLYAGTKKQVNDFNIWHSKNQCHTPVFYEYRSMFGFGGFG